MKKIGKPLVFGILCFLLSFAITMQIRFANTSESNSSQEKVTANLKNQIFKLNDDNLKKTQTLENLTKELNQVRDSIANDDITNSNSSELIKKYSIVLGETDVYGQGVVLKYQPYRNEYVSDMARDLRDLVNELKNAGAEAISINDERIISTSSIEMVKNVIEINGIEVKAPFTIKTIGNSETIYSGLIRPGGEVELIKESGVNINLKKDSKIKINKFSEF